MALGPELVFLEAGEIEVLFQRNAVRRVDAGDAWAALSFSRDRALFLSWDADLYGCCSVAPAEIRSLSSIASTIPPILGALKSHLAGAAISHAVALERDRVLDIGFRREIGAGFFQVRRLLLEATGRYSNLILLDEEGSVIEAAKHVYPSENRYRSILPGTSYVAPPPMEGIALEDFDTQAPDALAHLDFLRGVGRPLIRAIREGCGGVTAVPPEILRGLDTLKTGTGAILYQQIGNYVTAYTDVLTGAAPLGAESGLEAARVAVVSPLLRRHLDRAKASVRTQLERLLKSNERKLRETAVLLENRDEAERLMSTGRLILANAWAIPPHALEADLTEWTEAGEVVRCVTLDPAKDAAQNAEKYFARYKKRRLAVERAEKQISHLKAERDLLLEQMALLECHTDAGMVLAMQREVFPERPDKRDIGKKRKGGAKGQPLPPHKRLEYVEENADLYIGLSAKGNHYVTFRLAKNGDVWFHAQGIPGAHVILRFNAEPDEEAFGRMIERAASAAAWYSKGREGGRVRVDFTERRHVCAIAGAGVGQVTYRDFSTFFAEPSAWKENE